MNNIELYSAFFNFLKNKENKHNKYIDFITNREQYPELEKQIYIGFLINALALYSSELADYETVDFNITLESVLSDYENPARVTTNILFTEEIKNKIAYIVTTNKLLLDNYNQIKEQANIIYKEIKSNQ